MSTDDLDRLLASIGPISNLPTPPATPEYTTFIDERTQRLEAGLHNAVEIARSNVFRRTSTDEALLLVRASEHSNGGYGALLAVVDGYLEAAGLLPRHIALACSILKDYKAPKGYHKNHKRHDSAGPEDIREMQDVAQEEETHHANLLVLTALQMAASSLSNDTRRPSFWTSDVGRGTFTKAELKRTKTAMLSSARTKLDTTVESHQVRI